MVPRFRASSFLLCLFFVALPALPAARHSKAASYGHASAKCKRQIDALLARPAAAQAHWGISVTTLDGRVLYAKNDAQLFAPASNAKLCTTSAALALLGPQATTTTRVLAQGTIDAAGRLQGDLVLEGNGDASISGRVYPYNLHTERTDRPLAGLEALADQVVLRGVRSISGNVVGDDTAFPQERYGADWAWDDLEWDYGAPATALTINDNIVFLHVHPGASAGTPVTVRWTPDVPYYGTENVARTSTAGEGPSLGVDRAPGSKTVRLYGAVPAGSKGVDMGLAIEDPAMFAATAFRQMLLARGVQVSGNAVARHRWPTDTRSYAAEVRTPVALPQQPPGPMALLPAHMETGTVLAARTSVPLIEDITVTNKVSQNLHAELMLRLLGEQYGTDASIVQGARVVRQFLLNAGVAPEDIFFYDGSGMSEQDVITPRALTQLLRYIATRPWGGAFFRTLPVGGEDGTLADRFVRPPLRGHVVAKTGTLGEVNALSGLVTAHSGRRLVFSVLCNAHRTDVEGTTQTIDAIVAAIAAAN